MIKLAVILTLAALPATCQTIGTDLGIIAADIPTACGNASAYMTQVAQTPGVSSKLKQALTTANAKYAKYCGPAAQITADAATVVATIQTIIADIQKAQK